MQHEGTLVTSISNSRFGFAESVTSLPIPRAIERRPRLCDWAEMGPSAMLLTPMMMTRDSSWQ